MKMLLSYNCDLLNGMNGYLVGGFVAGKVVGRFVSDVRDGLERDIFLFVFVFSFY